MRPILKQSVLHTEQNIDQKYDIKQTQKPIQFEEWERKLPWIIHYESLLKKPALTEQDCLNFINICDEATKTHRLWAFDHHRADINVTEKFKSAGLTLIEKYCQPIESKYHLIITSLEHQQPNESDHLQFTDRLKDQLLSTVRVRNLVNQLSPTQTTKVRWSPPNTKTSDLDIEFENTKARFLKRFQDAIKSENRVLQEKHNDLQVEEEQLKKSEKNNKDLINTLKNEVESLTQRAQKKLAELMPVKEESKTITSIENIQVPPPPPPPPLPQFIKTPTTTAKALPAKEDKDQTHGPISISTAAINGIKLRKVTRTDETPKPPETKSPFAALVSQRRVLHYSMTTTTSIGDLEIADNLKNNALKIYMKEQSNAAIRDYIHHQTLAIEKLTQQKKSLTEFIQRIDAFISEQEKLHAVKTTSATPLSSTMTTTAIPFAPPPPPPPQPTPGLSTKKISLNPSSESTISSQKSKTKKTSSVNAPTQPRLSPDLIALISARRQALGENDGEDNDDVSPSTETISHQKESQTLEQQHKQEVLQKHIDKAKAIYAEPNNPYQLEIEKQLSRLRMDICSLANMLSNLALDETISTLKIKLTHARETISYPDADQTASSITEAQSIETRPSAQPEVTIQLDKIVEYNNKVLQLLQDDPEFTHYYSTEATQDPLLIGMIHQTDLTTLTKPILIDILILSQWIKNKQKEVGIDDASSFTEFYKDALEIRLSSATAAMQKICLQETAHKHFALGHSNLRLFADILLMITILPGLIVGATRRLALGHTFFLSTAISTEEKSFIRALKEDNSDERLLETISPQPSSR